MAIKVDDPPDDEARRASAKDCRRRRADYGFAICLQPIVSEQQCRESCDGENDDQQPRQNEHAHIEEKSKIQPAVENEIEQRRCLCQPEKSAENHRHDHGRDKELLRHVAKKRIHTRV